MSAYTRASFGDSSEVIQEYGSGEQGEVTYDTHRGSHGHAGASSSNPRDSDGVAPNAS